MRKNKSRFYAQEYALLHNETLVDAEVAHLPAQGGQKTLAVPAGTGASMDLAVSFDVQALRGAAGPFGVAVRAPPTWSSSTAASPTPGSFPNSSTMALRLNISAPDADGTRVVTAFGVRAVLPTFRVLKGESLHARILLDRPLAEVCPGKKRSSSCRFGCRVIIFDFSMGEKRRFV